MTELYWITRLDEINAIAGISCTILFILLLIGLICKILHNANTDLSEFIVGDFLRKKIKTILILTIISGLAVTFIPTSKDAYLIYGVGGTIDYVKNDSTAKELPHKAIEALDKWLETVNEDNK